MLQEFVLTFDTYREDFKKIFRDKHIESYFDLVKIVAKVLSMEHKIAFDNIKELQYGEYTGYYVYVIPDLPEYPDCFYFVSLSYGSCSICDTLEGIRDICGEDLPSEQAVDDYMTLALHIIQGFRKIPN